MKTKPCMCVLFLCSQHRQAVGGEKKKSWRFRSKEQQAKRLNIRMLKHSQSGRKLQHARLKASPHVKNRGTFSQRGLDEKPPWSYYLKLGWMEHQGICQREGDHTGQGGGKSDVIIELFPISNFMTLSKKEGEFKPLQNKITQDLA